MNTNMQIFNTNSIGGDYVHDSIELVLRDVAMALATTYGPWGSHSIIQQNLGCTSTKDGLQIAVNQKYDKSIASSIFDNVKQVLLSQVREVGDGSTSTGILLYYFYKKMLGLVKEGYSPNEIKTSVRDVVDRLIVTLKDTAKKIETPEEEYDTILTTLDGDIPMTEFLIRVLNQMTSTEPMVMIKTSENNEFHYDLVHGLEIEGSTIRPDVFFNGMTRQTYEEPWIVIVDGRLDMSLPLFMQLADLTVQQQQDIIFVATGVSDILMDTAVRMHKTAPQTFSRIAIFQSLQMVKTDAVQDIVASIGGKIVDPAGLKICEKLETLVNILATSKGSAERVLLLDGGMRISSPYSDDKLIQDRLNSIDEKIAMLKEDPQSVNDTMENLAYRKALLSNNYCKIYVGGNSEQRKNINYELLADAVPQIISARKHGIVEGFNTAIPNIIDGVLQSTMLGKLEHEILQALLYAYKRLSVHILYNKVGCIQKANETIDAMYKESGRYVPLNMRDGDTHKIYNSADTDRAILENATDMAVLLATAKQFISLSPEFNTFDKYISQDETLWE